MLLSESTDQCSAILQNLLEEGMDELLVIYVGKGLAASVEGSVLRKANHVVNLQNKSNWNLFSIMNLEKTVPIHRPMYARYH